uniref:Tetratricopeptide SHNi-TPR domain-containing protein n=1 Tax=Cyclophora tenuis TaxID=216820 RepID=A0A7S1GMX0_CYCTE
MTIRTEDCARDLSAKVDLHEQRASLYLYVGQLSVEEEALEKYQKGIEDLETAIDVCQKIATRIQDEGTDDMETDETVEEPIQKLRQQLCKAHCTVADLYLTDLCFAENAEQQCEMHARKAMEIEGENGKPLLDALQTLASLRLSQSRGLEAIDHILAAYDTMKVGCEALATLVGLGDSDPDLNGNAIELMEVEAANNLPEFEFRCQTAKLLLESASVLNESSEDEDGKREDHCIQCAIQVLGSLMAENDEVVEIWYLLGCAFSSVHPPQDEAARQYLSQAKDMLSKVKEELELEYKHDSENEEIHCQLEDIEAQLGNIETKLASLGGGGMHEEDD